MEYWSDGVLGFGFARESRPTLETGMQFAHYSITPIPHHSNRSVDSELPPGIKGEEIHR
jgi:hypothetical protein